MNITRRVLKVNEVLPMLIAMSFQRELGITLELDCTQLMIGLLDDRFPLVRPCVLRYKRIERNTTILSCFKMERWLVQIQYLLWLFPRDPKVSHGHQENKRDRKILEQSALFEPNQVPRSKAYL